MHYAQNDPRWLAAHGTTIKIQVLYNQHLTLAPYGLALFAPARCTLSTSSLLCIRVNLRLES